MQIITACSKDFREMADNLADNPNYNVKIYPLEEMVDHTRFIKECHYKLDFIKQTLKEQNDDVAWVDADCLIRGGLGDPLGDCDVAVTLRRQGAKDAYYNYSGLLNAGVIFFKNNLNASRFIDRWEKELPNGKYKTDQEALNIVTGVNEHTKVGDVIEKNGIKIKILSCDEYNFFYFPEENEARILHFKGDVRQYYENYTQKS